jgi:hypothetical protein
VSAKAFCNAYAESGAAMAGVLLVDGQSILLQQIRHALHVLSGEKARTTCDTDSAPPNLDMRCRTGYGKIVLDVLIGKVPCWCMCAVDEGVNRCLQLACAAR